MCGKQKNKARFYNHEKINISTFCGQEFFKYKCNYTAEKAPIKAKNNDKLMYSLVCV